jgi:inner membrane protein
MDTITHTLFGLTLYGAVDKTNLTRKEKNVLLFTSIAGSQIPDIDVISAWWDTSGRYQMWHRGITHSLFLVPVWAALFALIARYGFGLRGWLWFAVAMAAVFIHDTSDIFNAWGTGYFEPFSQVRLTFGVIPIVDLVFWALIAGGAIFARFGRARWRSHRIFQLVWLFIVLHIGIQSVQGALLLHEAKKQYEMVTLSADFIPGVFTVIGKNGTELHLQSGSVWGGMKHTATLTSAEDADLTPLFAINPEAKTLMEWSPFVVVVDDGKHLGVYDPRFYRNGESFLYEYIER